MMLSHSACVHMGVALVLAVTSGNGNGARGSAGQWSAAAPAPLAPGLLARAFGSHMVLQSAPSRASLWGHVSTPAARVTVTFAGHHRQVPCTLIWIVRPPYGVHGLNL